MHLPMFRLVSMTVIRDDHFSTRFQSFEKLVKEILFILDMQNGVPAVDHIIESFWIIHKSGILDVKMATVLDIGRLQVSQVIGNVDHIVGQVHSINLNAIVLGHIKGRSTNATANVQNLVIGLQGRWIKFLAELFGRGFASGADIGGAENPFIQKDAFPFVLVSVQKFLKLLVLLDACHAFQQQMRTMHSSIGGRTGSLA